MNPATAHARILVDELVRAGIRDVCIAPGSRSTPIVLAAARRPDELHLRVFLDERSAAFFALGIGKGAGRPAAVLTTSGTAVANLLPAVIEAAWSETPLIVLTADRPVRLRHSDANQVVVQRGIFSSYPVLELELPEPTEGVAPARHLRSTVSRAVAASIGLPAGPVHLNVPYDKPLEPGPASRGFGAEHEKATGRELESSAWAGRADGRPWTAVTERRPSATPVELERLATRLGGRRGVVVAGPHPEADRLGPVLQAFAGAWSVPLLADPLSGGRYGSTAGAVVPSSYDLFLRDSEVGQALRPEVVVRVGAAPTSASLMDWLDGADGAETVVIDAGRRWKDHRGFAADMVQACPVDTLRRLAERGLDSAAPEWSRRWSTADAAARAASLDAPLHEGHYARAVVQALPDGTALFVSSSMPVRDVDAFGGSRPHAVSVVGNRGASGIDGIVSTALGMSCGRGRTVVALIGDLAFLHDVNGFLAARESDAHVVFVVVNNDGGGIFHMLPIREHEPAFTPYFATPHGVALEHGAALYGVEHRAVLPDDLGSAVGEAVRAGRTVVLEVASDRESNRTGHRASIERAASAARAALLNPA